MSHGDKVCVLGLGNSAVLDTIDNCCSVAGLFLAEIQLILQAKARPCISFQYTVWYDL